MLLNLTAGVNFINILQASFASADPKRAKNTVNLSVFFALLGSSNVKDVSKMLTNLTIGPNLIKLLGTYLRT